MKTLRDLILILSIPFIFYFGVPFCVIALLILALCCNWNDPPLICYIAENYNPTLHGIFSLVLLLISIYIIIRKLLKKHDSIFLERRKERINLLRRQLQSKTFTDNS